MIDLEYLDNLPKRMSMFRSRKTRRNQWYDSYYSHRYRIPIDRDPYKLAFVIAKKYINRKFEDAFHHYCKLVKKQDQSEFLNLFKDQHHNKPWKYRPFILDSEGYIRPVYDLFHNIHCRKKKELVLTTKDYKIVYRLKAKYHCYSKLAIDNYNILKGEFKLIDEADRKWWQSIVFIPSGYESLYEEVIVSGQEFKYDHKSKRFKRYYAEKRKQCKLDRKRHQRALKEKAYCFLTSEEIKQKELRSKDIIDRDRHGFDEESFKGEFYHGRKRKRINK